MTNFYHNRITGLDAIHELMWITSTDPALDVANDVQPHQWWLDTTGGATLTAGGILKYRNAGNTAWTTVADITAALALKAALASPTFTGTPSAPTAAPGTNTTQLSTTAFVKAAIDALIASAPGALDTLDELAAALGDDANFASTVTTALAGKAPLASPALTGTPTAPTAAYGTDTTQIATMAAVQDAIATRVDDGNSSTADTIDFSAGNVHKSTLTGNCTYTFTAPPAGSVVILEVAQDATGSRTVTWPASVHWSGGTAPTLTTTASKVDIFTFYYNGTTYFGVTSGLNYTA